MRNNPDFERVYLPYLTINPNCISIHQELELGLKHHSQITSYLSNFKSNKTNGKISVNARKKISRSLDYIMYLARPKIIPHGYRGAGLKFKLNFITLTLPSRQIHSDVQIIQQILQPFLNYLRKHYHLHNYIWRAEKQRAGNLHFHIIIDKFIDKHELRFNWNRYCQDLGYISQYRLNQLDWHKNGFTYRNRLKKTWSYENQLRAYNEGQLQNWSNPNTTDIHSTKKIRNLKKYLCKYLCKNSNEKIQEEEINNSSINELLQISGRLWACSESLSKFKGIKTSYTSDIDRELQTILEKRNHEIFNSQFYTVYCIRVLELNQVDCPFLYELWNDYILANSPPD